MIGLMFVLAVAATQTPQTYGKETKIPFAANEGLRDWQAGPPNSGVIYVRDRSRNWYQVTLSGPCTTDTALDSLHYTTDTAGAFDTFSKVTVGRYPNQACGVTSIKTSAPPPGQPGAPKAKD